MHTIKRMGVALPLALGMLVVGSSPAFADFTSHTVGTAPAPVTATITGTASPDMLQIFAPHFAGGGGAPPTDGTRLTHDQTTGNAINPFPVFGYDSEYDFDRNDPVNAPGQAGEQVLPNNATSTLIVNAGDGADLVWIIEAMPGFFASNLAKITINAGPGDDDIRAADGLREVAIDCGPGNDKLERDPASIDPDAIITNCETVTPALASPPSGPGRPSGPIMGTAGDDTIQGTPGNDVIYGLAGNDKIYGNGGDDLIIGGTGNDKLFGLDGNDTLKGGKGTDKCVGGNGKDIAKKCEKVRTVP